MNNEMNTLIENIKEDYLKWTKGCAYARNAARGNIVDGGYTINWTGPLYL